jgi:nicotinate-nucleotide pyrophosphorylase (carboxylating)
MEEPPVAKERYEELVKRGLEEDFGEGDLTTDAMVPEDAPGRALVTAKAEGVIAGGFVAEEVFRQVGAEYRILVEDGRRVEPGTVVGRAKGGLRALLKGERVALNLLCRLSGIATLTRRFVDEVEGTKARILDTRKTAPLYRALEKYAVRTGGGVNHRMGLADQVLVKENHFAAARASGRAKSFAGSLRLLRENLPDGVVVGIEVRDLSELHMALEVEPDYVLCDNFRSEDLALAVRIRDDWPGEKRVELEASGGVRLGNVAEVAATGVDRISVGALTHSAPTLDLSMKIAED